MKPSHFKLLIADSESNLLVSLEFLMQRKGYAVVLARDGQEALEAIERERPDLLVIDASLPVRSGYEVCQAVRHSESLKNMPILMLSTKSQKTDVAKGLALGASAYLTKPFSTQELVQKVQYMLGDLP